MIDHILNAREHRMFDVKKALDQNPLILLIKANIPGDNKNLWFSKYLVLYFQKLLKHTCENEDSFYYESMDGPYVIMHLSDDDPEIIKRCLMHIEETHPLGRFIDLDLFHQKEHSISRTDMNAPLRTCFLCKEPAIECMRYHRHSTSEMIQYIESHVKDYILSDMRKQMDIAIMSELDLEDKFGLVTKTSSGSHQDMDYALMIKAKDAILDDLVDIFKLGLESDSLINLFIQAKEKGIQAETHMLVATHNINCYKGLITVLGFAALSSGYALSHNQSFDDIFENIKDLSKDILNDFEKPSHTFGIKAYKEYQFMGIRGEISQGLPTVKHILRNYDHLNINDSKTLRKALKDIILLSDDSVFLKRSGSLNNYETIKQNLSTLDMDNLDEIKKFTESMIQKNISFGGSADLLITVIYLQNIKHLFH